MAIRWNLSNLLCYEKNIQSEINSRYTKDFNILLKKNFINGYVKDHKNVLTNSNLIKKYFENGFKDSVLKKDWILLKRKVKKNTARFLGRPKYEKRLNRIIIKDYFAVFNFSNHRKVIFSKYYNNKNFLYRWVRINDWVKRTRRLKYKRINLLYLYKTQLVHYSRFKKLNSQSKNNNLLIFKFNMFKRYTHKKYINISISSACKMWNNKSEMCGLEVLSDFNSNSTNSLSTLMLNNLSRVELKQDWLFEFFTYLKR